MSDDSEFTGVNRDGWKEFVDVANVAAAGYSCGGVLALDTARDKRIRTAVILNSGVFRAKLPGVTLTKSDLKQLKDPVLGGATDVLNWAGNDQGFLTIRQVSS